MERYQLSQDFAEKQLQLLQRKYGGAHQAGTAALTIQRAFRRYSMAKKFADLTSHAKAEQRASRRLDCGNNNAQTPPTPTSTQESTPRPVHHQRHHHAHHHHHHHHHHCPRPPLQSQSHGPVMVQHSLEDKLQPQPLFFIASSSSDAEGSSNSCPDIQSFPLDETSVYSNHKQQLTQRLQRQPSPRSAGREAAASTNSLWGNSKSPQSADSSPRGRKSLTPSASAPSVPRRTTPVQQHGQDESDHRVLLRQHSYREGAAAASGNYTLNEVIRKRHYRTGLNIFNKRPEKGIAYLIRRGFLEHSPQAVARFLITRKGLSKQMIGEYLGNLSHPFNMAVLECFALEMDFSGMQIDTALRKFQTYFRMPGEAQKIERLMEVFSGRFCQCNPDVVSKLHSTDTTFILAFAIILLNTDLHTPSLKPEKRMKVEDFVRNLRGIDDGHDVDLDMLVGIYDRIRSQEFRPGGDHVTQVLKVQQTIVSKCPNLAVPYRRLVCYCRLYEVHDPYKKERPGIHQREVFLFNDLLVMTKIHSRKKNTVTYAFRQSHLLAGLLVTLFETPFYPFGIQLSQKWDRKVVLRLNARNEHDRSKFVEDLRESIAEMDELEALRLEAELEKQRHSLVNSSSLVVDRGGSGKERHHQHGNNNNVSDLRRSAINNSLLDLSEATAEKLTRRGSVGSLDSGMSVSFQSTSVGSFCNKEAARMRQQQHKH